MELLRMQGALGEIFSIKYIEDDSQGHPLTIINFDPTQNTDPIALEFTEQEVETLIKVLQNRSSY